MAKTQRSCAVFTKITQSENTSDQALVRPMDGDARFISGAVARGA
jgi:hypothetical protein